MRFRSSLPDSLTAFVILVLLPTLASAALTWDARKVELTTKPSDKDAVAVFRFTNTGNAAVTVTSIVPACGCTTAELAKRTYAPGESGEIKAVLLIGDRTGLQEKTIQVITDDAPAAPTVLTLQATIPEQFAFTSRLLLWRMAEVLAEKSTIITNTSPQKIAAIEPLPVSTAGATVRIDELEPGMKYRLAFRPISLAQPANHVLSFVMRFADNSTQQFSVHVVVK